MLSTRPCTQLFLATLLLLAQTNSVVLAHHPGDEESNGMSPLDSSTRSTIVQSYSKLPLSFEANQGQTDSQVKFVSHGAGYTLFLTTDEAVFSFCDRAMATNRAHFGNRFPSREGLPNAKAVLRMKLRNVNTSAKVVGLDQLRGKNNYFLGNDARRWQSDISTFGKVKYEGVYPGIDLVYYGNQRQLEYDFVVAPGANVQQIQFDFPGSRHRIKQDRDGNLALRVGDADFRWHKPTVYQVKDGIKREIAAHYAVDDQNRVAFAIADYDPRRTLFIDPLVYSTYLGGSLVDEGLGIAVDGSGNSYVTGATRSTDFPTMNALAPNYHGGDSDAFIVKIDPTGVLLYSTYFGGSMTDVGTGIAVDSSGSAYLTGLTTSTDLPTMNALQPANAGGADAFVVKINPTGSALVYSTYLGGSGNDSGAGIAVDHAGAAYIIGNTTSANFPTKRPLQPTNSGDGDAFVAKINRTGSVLVYSTYLGGSGNDLGTGIAQLYGAVYVTGYTNSIDFPTAHAIQPTYGGGFEDAFVAKINSSGSALVYSTYLGGSKDDSGFGIAVDVAGSAYVTGATTSTDFPTVNPFQRTGRGGNDVFVTKVNPSGSALVYSSYLGGTADDFGYSIAVDLGGYAYVTGLTLSTNFRTVKPLQGVSGGNGDAFVTKINSAGSALAYSTYLGGSGVDQGNSIAQHAGNAYITGFTESTNFPTMNPLQSASGGNADAFIAVISKPER